MRLNAQIEDLVSRLKEQTAINAQLSAKIDDFKAFRLNLDESSILKITELKNALNSVNLPSEIKLTKSVQFSDMTKTVLVWFFAVSLLIVGGSLFYAHHASAEASKITAPSELQDARVDWLLDYVDDMKLKNPKSHDAYVAKHPFPND